MKYKIYLDYQGTVVEQGLDRCVFGCFEVIKKLQDAGHTVFLNTSHSEEKDKTCLNAALKYINEDCWIFVNRKDRDTFELQPITDLGYKASPDRWDWDLHNQTGIIYIDDYSRDIPLKKSGFTNSNIVDWVKLDIEFQNKGLY